MQGINWQTDSEAFSSSEHTTAEGIPWSSQTATMAAAAAAFVATRHRQADWLLLLKHFGFALTCPVVRISSSCPESILKTAVHSFLLRQAKTAEPDSSWALLLFAKGCTVSVHSRPPVKAAVIWGLWEFERQSFTITKDQDKSEREPVLSA